MKQQKQQGFNISRLNLAVQSAIFSLFFTASSSVWATSAADLGEISVVSDAGKPASVAGVGVVSDKVVAGEAFKSRSATLGNALAKELGVHSNPFGGGASSPIIRGQEGVRLKILQNGSDVIDMSAISPDHAVAVDTLLAEQVELVRGASTLMYAMASPAGVVNVVDKRIPSRKPEKGFEGELHSRFDTAAKEKAVSGGLTLGLGEHWVLRAEGLQRHSDNYRVPRIKLGETLNYLPDSHSRSKVGTLGLSWVGEKGYLGASFSRRKDQYGLVGHNHKFDKCTAHILFPKDHQYSYVFLYPHLMEEFMVNENPHFHCGTDFDLDHNHSHDNPFGTNFDHHHAGPWVDLLSKRWDVKGEWREPFAGVAKIKASYAYADYYHDEKDAGKASGSFSARYQNPRKNFGKPVNIFKNRGQNARLEITHSPLLNGDLTGVWGVQYQTQTSGARTPDNREIRQPLIRNRNQQISLFGLEQLVWRDFAFELGGRWEQQKIHIDYDLSELERYRQIHGRYTRQYLPDLSLYNEKAFSYSGTANWFFHPDYRLSLSASHNERLPTPMELYYHGQHLATNSFEYGNRRLNKEKSNNLELGLAYQTERLDYKISAYYNQFDNYIYNQTLYREANLFMRRYTQAKAEFYGLEGEISYRFNPTYQATLFGDWIRGTLYDLPDVLGKEVYSEEFYDEEVGEYRRENFGREVLSQGNRPPPRLPPARFGARLQAKWGEHWQANAEYLHVFGQKRVGKNESTTEGYNLVNAGLSYARQWQGLEYKISLNAQNLLNEGVYIHTSYQSYVPQIGRNFSLGMEVKF